jgi:hypothetical protein
MLQRRSAFCAPNERGTTHIMKWMFVGMMLILVTLNSARAALIYGGDSGHTTAPTSDPGWGRVGRCGSTTIGNTGIYMGNGWVLTAFHGEAKGSFTVDDGKEYTEISDPSTGRVGLADLYLFRVDVQPGDPLSEFGYMSMASSAPTSGTTGTHIGTGIGQTDPETADNYWNKEGTWYNSEPTGQSSAFVGYTWDYGTDFDMRDTRWNYQNVSSTAAAPGLFFADFVNEDGYGMLTDKDSGSPFFVDGELTGIGVGVGALGAMPAPLVAPEDTFIASDPDVATYRGLTQYVDVSDYVAAITEVITTPEPATMSLLAIGGIALICRRRRA